MNSQVHAIEEQREETVATLHASSQEQLGAQPDLNGVQIQTQAPAKRERLISAQLLVPHPYTQAQLWAVLTDYEALADFLPNLELSRRLPHPEGEIRLEQVGVQRMMKLKFKARVVLDLIEHPLSRIDFVMAEGDFQRFEGFWALEPKPEGVLLSYEVDVIPNRTLPIQLIENRICQDLSVNLVAMRDRVQALHPNA